MLLRGKLYFILFFIAICHKLDAENYFTKYTKYTTEHGLLNNNINSLFQDKSGLLWIGCSHGISIYNTHHFENFQVPDHHFNDSIKHINQIDDQYLFVGTNKGVYIFDIPSKKYISLSVVDKPLKQLAFSFQMKGRLFLAGKSGIFEYLKRSRSIKQISDLSVSCGQESPEGKIWLGTYDQGIQEVELLTEAFQFSSISQKLKNETIKSILFKSDHSPVVHSNRGIWLHGDNGFYLDAKGLFSTVGIDLKGDIYMTISKKGFMFLKNMSSMPVFDEMVNQELNDYHDRKFSVSFTDGSGAIWLGTEESGLIKIGQKNISYKQYNTNTDFSINYVNGIMPLDHGKFLAGLSQIGLFISDKNQEKLLPILKDEKVKFIEAIVRKDDVIYLGTRNYGVVSVALKDGKNVDTGQIKQIYNYREGLIENAHILDLSINKDELFIGSKQGCFAYSFKTKTIEKVSNIPSIKYRQDSSHNNVNISTENELFFNGNKIIPNTYVSDFTFDDKKNIWLATTDGLVVIQTETLESSFFKPHYGNLKFTSVQIDQEGHVWLGSRMGIFCYHPDLKSFARYKIKGKSIDNSFNEGTICMSEKGEILLGGNNGVISILPEEKKLLPPPKFQVHENLNGVDGIFSVTNLSFNHQNDNAIAYRFVHPDSSWHIHRYDKEIIDLTYLPALTYEVEFNAINSDGIWGEAYKTSFWTENEEKPALLIYAIVFIFVVLLILGSLFLKQEDENKIM